MDTTHRIDQLYAPVAQPLAQVRTEIEALWREAMSLVSAEMAAQPLLSGKMLRPALCLLSAGATGETNLPHYVGLATAFEALHIASLTHDDVIDKALLRRGTSALNAVWNNHAAVLGGDYLVARAIEILTQYDSCAVVANAIRSVRRMAEGELTFFGRTEEPIVYEECIQLAEQKTASLFAEACSASTHITGPRYQNALHAYGTNLGIAFQIVDDILDLTQPASKLGKPACGDIVEAKKTLPIMFLKERLANADLLRLEAMRNTSLSEADQQWITQQVIDTGAKERTDAIARDYADLARQELQRLPASPYRDSLHGVLDFILHRIA